MVRRAVPGRRGRSHGTSLPGQWCSLGSGLGRTVVSCWRGLRPPLHPRRPGTARRTTAQPRARFSCPASVFLAPYGSQLGEWVPTGDHPRSRKFAVEAPGRVAGNSSVAGTRVRGRSIRDPLVRRPTNGAKDKARRAQRPFVGLWVRGACPGRRGWRGGRRLLQQETTVRPSPDPSEHHCSRREFQCERPRRPGRAPLTHHPPNHRSPPADELSAAHAHLED